MTTLISVTVVLAVLLGWYEEHENNKKEKACKDQTSSNS